MGESDSPTGPIHREVETSVTGRLFTESPHSQLLRRFLSGEATEDELADDGMLRAMATSVIELQEIVLKTVRRFGPLLAEREPPKTAS
jgi:hypothetical protein